VGAIRRRIWPRWLGALAVRLVVGADTGFLAWRIVARRVRLLGVPALFGLRPVTDTPVVYLDLGTHEQPGELTFAHAMLRRLCRDLTVFGFEANAASSRAAQEAVAGLDRVQVLHGAVCRVVPANGLVQLYSPSSPHGKGPRGRGDSLYRRSDAGTPVRAIRLSAWLREQGLADGERVLLLRMNIEGAEFDVLHDLADAALTRMVDGYYGLWDDLSKFDEETDREFRRFTAGQGIRPVTFNGRDLRWPWRRRLIAYDLRTSVHAGARRIARGAGHRR
jgi:FkbM family methyltransferase